MNLQNIFIEINQSFRLHAQFSPSNTGFSHSYFTVDEGDSLGMTHNRNERASLKKIARAIKRILKNDNLSIETLKEIKISLTHLKVNYQKRYDESLIKKFLEFRVFVIFFKIFGIEIQNLDSIDVLIKHVGLKIPQENQSEVEEGNNEQVEFDKLGAVQFLEKELLAMEGVMLKEANASEQTSPFVFCMIGQMVRVKIFHNNQEFVFEFPTGDVDTAKKIKLLLSIFQNSDIAVNSYADMNGKKILITFLPEENPKTHLNILNLGAEKSMELLLSTPSCQLEKYIQIVADNHIQNYSFGSAAFSIPSNKLYESENFSVLSHDRIIELLDRYCPEHKTRYAWPASDKTTVGQVIASSYVRGIKKSTTHKDVTLENDSNMFFIHYLHQIFHHIDSLDKAKKAVKELEDLLKTIVHYFTACQAIRIQGILQIYQHLFHPEATFEGYIVEEWIRFKERIFDSYFSQFDSYFSQSEGVDVHLRNAYIQAVGIIYGFSFVLINGAIGDPHVDPSVQASHIVSFDTISKYQNMLYEAFPSFVKQIAQYINSLRGDKLFVYDQWKLKNAKNILPSFGFRSSLMKYNQGELSSTEVSDVDLNESREYFMLPHISLSEVYEILHLIGIVQCKRPLTLAVNAVEENIEERDVITIELGDFLPEFRVNGIAWNSAPNIVYQVSEPVIVFSDDKYQYACVVQAGPTTSDRIRYFNGREICQAYASELRKIKVPIMLGKKSLMSLETIRYV